MRQTSYIITWRQAGDPARRRNLEIVLAWLSRLDLGEIIIVEQDVAPLLGDLPPASALRVAFAYNPGLFNKSWGFNVGARLARMPVLAFADADVLCATLPQAAAGLRTGAAAIRPFDGVVDLTEDEARILAADPAVIARSDFGQAPPSRRQIGENLPFCGGLVLFQRDFLSLLGGWDERFEGWGGEDDAMDLKLRRGAVPHRLIEGARGFHLPHRRAMPDHPHYATNLALLAELQTLPEEALHRLCEVTWQLAGNRERHRPQERLP